MEKEEQKEMKANVKKWLRVHKTIEEGDAELISDAVLKVYLEAEPLVVSDFKECLREVMATEEYKILCKQRAKEWLESSLVDPESMEMLWEEEEFRKFMLKLVIGLFKKGYEEK